MSGTEILYGFERYELLFKDFDAFKSKLNNVKCRKTEHLKDAATKCLLKVKELSLLVEDDYQSRDAATQRWIELYYHIQKEIDKRA